MAILVADESGSVDTTRDPSVGGTYRGIDAHGLWWSAEPVAPAQPAS